MRLGGDQFPSYKPNNAPLFVLSISTLSSSVAVVPSSSSLVISRCCRPCLAQKILQQCTNHDSSVFYACEEKRIRKKVKEEEISSEENHWFSDSWIWVIVDVDLVHKFKGRWAACETPNYVAPEGNYKMKFQALLDLLLPIWNGYRSVMIMEFEIVNDKECFLPSTSTSNNNFKASTSTPSSRTPGTVVAVASEEEQSPVSPGRHVHFGAVVVIGSEGNKSQESAQGPESDKGESSSSPQEKALRESEIPLAFS
ncbi:hypothetical protein QYF36_014658 [Acer negundo]|nr:hypothetical protein QYF36_014658 [Acer negundo]